MKSKKFNLFDVTKFFDGQDSLILSYLWPRNIASTFKWSNSSKNCLFSNNYCKVCFRCVTIIGPVRICWPLLLNVFFFFRQLFSSLHIWIFSFKNRFLASIWCKLVLSPNLMLVTHVWNGSGFMNQKDGFHVCGVHLYRGSYHRRIPHFLRHLSCNFQPHW